MQLHRLETIEQDIGALDLPIAERLGAHRIQHALLL
jgi:hypothetical protein